MPISSNFNSIHTHAHLIDFSECGPDGKLTLVALCRIVQKAAMAHSILGGISFEDLQIFHQAWVLHKMRIEVQSLPRWQDEIEIRTWIQHLEGTQSVRNYELYFKGSKLVGITTLWVIINTQKRRPEVMSLPHQHFEKFSDRKATSGDFEKISNQLTYEVIKEDSVVYSDLDMVVHVNNVKYIEWLFNAIDYNQLMSQRVCTLDMVFKKEMKHGTHYQIERAQIEEGVACYAVTSHGAKNFQCKLYWDTALKNI